MDLFTFTSAVRLRYFTTVSCTHIALADLTLKAWSRRIESRESVPREGSQHRQQATGHRQLQRTLTKFSFCAPWVKGVKM